MADTTLQSFLVRLGFLVDPAGHKRFTDAINESGRQVNDLRLGLIALAVGVEETVRRATRSFDNLYQASRLSNDSAKNIVRLGAEMTAAGLDGEKAAAAAAEQIDKLTRSGTGVVESLAAALNISPKPVEFIEGLVTRYHEIVQKFGEDSQQALGFKSMLEGMHIDFEGTIRPLERFYDATKEYSGKIVEVYKKLGIDTKEQYDAYTKRANEMDLVFEGLGKTFWTAFGRVVTDKDISASILSIGNSLQTWIVSDQTRDAVQGILDSIDKSLKDPETRKEIKTALHDLGEVVIGIAGAVKWLIDTMGVKGLAEIFGGYEAIKIIGGIATALRALGIATFAANPLLLIVGGTILLLITHWQDLLQIVKDVTAGLEGAWDRLTAVFHGAPAEPNQPLPAGAGPPRPTGEATPFGGPATEAEKAFHYQHGGIVPASLHPGEMVLPRQISEGLQQLFMRGPAYGGFPANDNQMADQIDRWLHGDTSFKPIVDLANQSFEQLRNLFLDFFPEAAPGAAPGTPGGAGEGVPGGPGGGAQPGTPTRADPRGMIPVIRAAAIAAGVDPDIAVRVARSEGLTDFFGDRGTSGGAFQLHRGGGLGDDFYKETGKDPLDPKNEAATIEWAMKKVKQTGWGPWHGAARIGIGAREGLDYVPREAPGGGAARFSAGGVNLGRVNQALVETLAAASKYLPEGYRVQATSGEREGGLPGSQHHGGQALDVRIIDSEGKPIPNKAPLGSAPGLYATLAHGWYQEVAKRHPELRNAAAWGGEFETSPGSGKADWMHFDFGKRRGRFTRGDWAYIDNSTTTVVAQATDPHGTARAVSDLRDRRSAQHIRNFRTNVA